ncbi:unknown [Clostridium sp. CAG:354]|nr:hypothetical protein [Clostridium sp.]MEE0269148.1 hypothetical protein [Clostridia bacterium]CDE10028.1 unknown [Clostridium sp. CAG:354]
MKNIELKYIEINLFEKEVYQYYIEIFPEEERKPFKLIKTSYEKRIYKYYRNSI